MAEVADLKVQLNLTIRELRNLVALATLGNERLTELGEAVPMVEGANEGDEPEPLAEHIGGLYFELMEQLAEASDGLITEG